MCGFGKFRNARVTVLKLPDCVYLTHMTNVFLTRRSVLLIFFTMVLFAFAGWFGAVYEPSRAANLTPQYAVSITAYAPRTNSVVFHPQSGKIYASVPGGTYQYSDSVVRIDPTTGDVEQSIWVGSEPGKLELAGDGNTLYVHLVGSMSIRSIDLSTGTAGQEFRAGQTDIYGPYRVVDFAVSPINPNVIAVSREKAYDSTYRSVALLDNGIPRPNSGGLSGPLTFANTDQVSLRSTTATVSFKPSVWGQTVLRP